MRAMCLPRWPRNIQRHGKLANTAAYPPQTDVRLAVDSMHFVVFGMRCRLLSPWIVALAHSWLLLSCLGWVVFCIVCLGISHTQAKRERRKKKKDRSKPARKQASKQHHQEKKKRKKKKEQTRDTHKEQSRKTKHKRRRTKQMWWRCKTDKQTSKRARRKETTATRGGERVAKR